MKFSYSLPVLKKNQFPNIPFMKKYRIAFHVKKNGEVELVGNSMGLAYLAKYLAAMSMIKNNDGLHVHLDPKLRKLDNKSNPLTIRNLNFEIKKGRLLVSNRAGI